MTLKDLATKLFDEAKAGKVGDALDTGAEFLKQLAGFYKLVWGAAVAEDVAAAEVVLLALKVDLSAHCSCVEKDGTCKQLAAMGDAQFDPTPLILTLVDLILKVIAERRKNKQ